MDHIHKDIYYSIILCAGVLDGTICGNFQSDYIPVVENHLWHWSYLVLCILPFFCIMFSEFTKILVSLEDKPHILVH